MNLVSNHHSAQQSRANEDASSARHVRAVAQTQKTTGKDKYILEGCLSSSNICQRGQLWEYESHLEG